MFEKLLIVIALISVIIVILKLFGRMLFSSVGSIVAFMLFSIMVVFLLSDDNFHKSIQSSFIASNESKNNKILNPDEFDFNSLEATAAGSNDSSNVESINNDDECDNSKNLECIYKSLQKSREGLTSR